MCETVVPFGLSPPLEPSLPWEPCRPGNKQSFVSTDPQCPAARLQTSTPVLIENRRRGVCRGGRASFSRIHLCFHHCPSKQAQSGRVLWCSGDHRIIIFFTNILSAPTLSTKHSGYLCRRFMLWHRFMLIKLMHSLELL